MIKSKLSLLQRMRPSRAVVATRVRRIDDEAVTYLVSALIAIAAMLTATMAGFVR